MASDNLEQVAIDNGLWDGKGDFVFWKVIVCSYAQGRNYREREFRVFDLLAPSLGLKYGMEDFPFSVKPDSLVDVRKVMALLRDTYEGTEWDMCKNWTIDVPEKDGVPAHKEMSPLANPWLTTPMRNTLNSIAPGVIDFKRTLAVAWCSYSTVIQSRSWLPDGIGGVCWYAVDNPAQSPRIPISAEVQFYRTPLKSAASRNTTRTVCCGSSAAPTSWPPFRGRRPRRSSRTMFWRWRRWPSKACLSLRLNIQRPPLARGRGC